MLAHSQDFKKSIKEYGRQFDYKITLEDRVLGAEDIFACTLITNTDLLKSAMKEFNFEIKDDLEANTRLKVEIGVLIDTEYKYLNYGYYYVKDKTYNADTQTYSYVCYDKMLFSMVDYKGLKEGQFPMTLKKFYENLCSDLGINSVYYNFTNYDLVIPTDPYLNGQYTYRDIFDDIAEATGSNLVIKLVNDEERLDVFTYNQTYDQIDEEFLKDTEININKRYGPINSVVLSRSGGADNIYKKNQDSIDASGLCEIKITDNQIMNFNDRNDYLQGIFDNLFNLTYYLYDVKTIGIGYYEPFDMFDIKIGDSYYNCIVMNDEQDYTNGLEERLYVDEPEVSETDYKKADETDRRINETYLIVDKQNQSIQSVVSKQDEQTKQMSKIIQDVSKIEQSISEIADITTSSEGVGVRVLENVNESEPVYLGIRPTSYDVTRLYPSNNLYPSSTLYTKNMKVIFESKDNTIEYELPVNLLIKDKVYDEFILDYNSNKCYKIQRIAYDENGEKYILDNEVEIPLKYPEINLTNGNYRIYMPSHETAYLSVRLMASNIYTEQFATKVELKSTISQTKDEIYGIVEKSLDNQDNEIAKLSIKSDNISTQVQKKVGKEEVISRINHSAEAISINANKISLEGKQINLSSDNISITSNNFKVDNQGNMTCNNANVTGTINSNNGSIGGWTMNSNGLTNGSVSIKNNGYSNIYTYADMVIIRNYLQGKIDLSENDIQHYDLNGDGIVNSQDLLIMRQRILG